MSFMSNALLFQLFHNTYIWRYIFQCARLVPEITIIGYAQNQTIGQSNDLKSLATRLSMSEEASYLIATWSY
jgi:hypothetical protein